MARADRGGAARRSPSEDDTAAIARDLAGNLAPGDLVLLYGDLGAGKTAFVRGLAEGLGADPDDVSSPTFTIMQEYRGRILLRHLDLYRIESLEEVVELDLEEASAGAVVAVEWAERLGTAPPGAWTVHLRVVDDTTREIVIAGPPTTTGARGRA